MPIYIAHRRKKTSNALDTLVQVRTKMFSINVWKNRQYTSDHGGQLSELVQMPFSLEMHPVYGDKCFTRPAIHVWCKKFAHRRERVVD